MTAAIEMHLAPAVEPASCSVCAGAADSAGGLRLIRADTAEPVCRGCGRRHAPALTALLDLAGSADRVGRIGRHGVFPPLTALLDLARAAEKYTGAAPGRA